MRRQHLSAPSARRALLATVIALVALAPPPARAEPVKVRHLEGLAHGFVALRTLEGNTLATGDLTQHTTGKQVTTRLHLRFKDGSTHQETTVFSQQGTFRLISNHVVQKGPAFKRQIDSTIHRDGRVTVRYSEDGGEEKRVEERMQLPRDLANGLVLVTLKNLPSGVKKWEVSFVAMTPKPTLVKLEIGADGEDDFSTAGFERRATRYTVKVNVPGLKGVVASIAGKTPPDSHIWMLGGDAPVLVRAEMTLASDAPLWRIDVVGPSWPAAGAQGVAEKK